MLYRTFTHYSSAMQTAPVIKNKFIFCLLFFASTVSQSFSQQNNKYHFFIEAGGFISAVSSGMRVDVKNGRTGTDLDLENDLGLADHTTIFRADGLIKLKRRSSFTVTGLIIRRGNDYLLGRDIEVGDSTYHIGASITTKFNTAYFGLSYRYAIFFKKKWEAGASIGLRLLTIKSGIEPSFGDSASTDNLAKALPSPLFGLFVNYNITPELNLTATGELVDVTISGITGTVIDSRIAARYYFWKNFSVGTAFSFTSYNADNISLTKHFTSEINYHFSGLTFFLGYRF